MQGQGIHTGSNGRVDNQPRRLTLLLYNGYSRRGIFLLEAGTMRDGRPGQLCFLGPCRCLRLCVFNAATSCLRLLSHVNVVLFLPSDEEIVIGFDVRPNYGEYSTDTVGADG